MKLIRLFLGLLVTGLFLVLYIQPVKADVNNFTINDFYAIYELNKDAPGGSMTVTEKIQLTFTDNNHGILRSLPKKNLGIPHKLQILNVQRDGSAEPYTTYSENNNLVLKIGDADRTITGRHTYTIRYEINRGAISFYSDKTEWYWDINGTDWGQPFEQVRGELILPSGVKAGETACYTGASGISNRNCLVNPKEDNRVSFTTTAPLAIRENLTIAVAMPAGIFTPYMWTDWIKDNMAQLIGVAFGITAFLIAFRIWLKYGRDYSGRGTIIPQYDPPKRPYPY